MKKLTLLAYILLLAALLSCGVGEGDHEMEEVIEQNVYMHDGRFETLKMS